MLALYLRCQWLSGVWRKALQSNRLRRRRLHRYYETPDGYRFQTQDAALAHTLWSERGTEPVVLREFSLR